MIYIYIYIYGFTVRIHPNNTNIQEKKFKNTNFDNNYQHEFDLKRAQMIPNDPKMTSNELVKKKK